MRIANRISISLRGVIVSISLIGACWIGVVDKEQRTAVLQIVALVAGGYFGAEQPIQQGTPTLVDKSTKRDEDDKE